MRTLAIAAALLLAAAPLHAQAASHGKLQWAPAPDALPKGAKMAVVRGDPSSAGPFTVRLSMPNKFIVPPHYHPTAETVTVKVGTLLAGMGDTFNADSMKPLRKGQSADIPAKQHHFVQTRGATVIEISGKGPFAITYVHPKDDPRNAAAKP
jgi:hypothetical protein